MKEYQNFIDNFVRQNQSILGSSLVGVYLHGSAVMGCFNGKRSDLDFIIVVHHDLPAAVKRRYMDMVVAQNTQAPAKGIELSIVEESVCQPFVYPTPFVLHFSVAHLDWYRSNPADYIEKMNGTDKDLAAHFTILYHRGRHSAARKFAKFSPKLIPRIILTASGAISKTQSGKSWKIQCTSPLIYAGYSPIGRNVSSCPSWKAENGDLQTFRKNMHPCSPTRWLNTHLTAPWSQTRHSPESMPPIC